MQLKSNTGSKILKIGITGGIGSGKTIASNIFHLLGIPLYNADDRAKWILVNDFKVKANIIKEFGQEVYEGGRLNRQYLSGLVFNNPDRLKMLNSIVHPAVGMDFQKWYELQSGTIYVLKEAALLFEAGSYKDLDKIITVYSPVALRIERILKRDPQRTESDIRKIMAEQMSDDEKISKSDYIIYNDEKHMLIPQILSIHEELKK